MNADENGRNDEEEEARVKADIRKRLESVCSGWGDAEKEKLVADIARIALRFRKLPFR